jgi:hypothetical protein
MTEDGLWELLDRTRPTVVDPAAHAEALTAELVAAGVDTTVEVGRQFDRAMAELHRWDLWAAIHVLLLGCSDDGFEYARAWIIGRGKDAFEHARRDPEGYVVHLVGGTDHDESAVAERIEDLAVLDGEPLLYAAGVAHERLTGAWRPADSGAPGGAAGPSGEPWTEDSVAARVPRLVAALPEGWLEDAGRVDPDAMAFATPFGDLGVAEVVGAAASANLAFDTSQRILAGGEAHESGDSRRAAELLGPVVDDPQRWALVTSIGFDPAGVAYVAGISFLFGGDVDRAAHALRLGLAWGPDDRVHRALAQVELARGDLVAAEQLLDPNPRADLMDQALVVTLRWRQGRRADAAQLASALVRAKPRRQQRGQHPWTVAGILLQAAFVLAELGDVATLRIATDRVEGLIRGGPAELPARGQWQIVVGSLRRQEGRLDEADRVLADAAPLLDAGTCDRGLLEREQARVARARNDVAGAQQRYAQAIATFESAGERWHAEETRQEIGAS